MSTILSEFLTQQDADADTVQQAVRYYVAERTDDLAPEEMRQQLVEVIGDADAVHSALRAMERDTAAVEAASLLLLSSAWEEPGERERIQGAIEDAKVKLPVIEVGIIAIVAMYAMYLATTGGVKEKRRVVKHNPDGTFTETEVTEYFDPSGPLASVAKLFGFGV